MPNAFFPDTFDSINVDDDENDRKINHASKNDKVETSEQITESPFLIVDEDAYERNVLSDLNKRIRKDVLENSSKKLSKLSKVINDCDEVLQSTDSQTKKYFQAQSRRSNALAQQNDIVTEALLTWNDIDKNGHEDKAENSIQNITNYETFNASLNIANDDNGGGNDFYGSYPSIESIPTSDDLVVISDSTSGSSDEENYDFGKKSSIEDDLDDDVYAEVC